MTKRREPAPDSFGLSPRELEVLSYLPLGYTNKQIALALGTSAGTVRNQLSNAYLKLGVACRAEAVGVLLRMPHEVLSRDGTPFDRVEDRLMTRGT
ncbi:MAG: LuxR C-terminal-related transcriptional regulator [Myxococcales bacterium]|nr:LuxR C-terminal-related transcriptional regulator [Myxococcales bacterium]